MPKRDKHLPRHRGSEAGPALTKRLRASVACSGIAVAVTGLAVAGGIVIEDQTSVDPAAATVAAAEPQRGTADLAGALADREVAVSRSDSRTDRRSTGSKREALRQESGGQVTRTESLADQDPRAVARQLMPQYGLSEAEFGCLDALWVSESDWDPHADNPTSSAYGIPQALTGGTHDDLPGDYMTNPVSQIRWGLQYIRDSYGTACSAWEFKQANNWY